MKEGTEKEILSKAAAFCSVSERCCAEVELKLTAWEVPDNLKPGIMEWLLKERYVDERRYCRSFIHDKFRFNKWGKLKIAQMLRLKGIPAETINQELMLIDEAEYYRVLSGLIHGKRKSVKAKNPYDLNAKLIRFAAGRGFGTDEIRRCINDTDDVEMD